MQSRLFPQETYILGCLLLAFAEPLYVTDNTPSADGVYFIHRLLETIVVPSDFVPEGAFHTIPFSVILSPLFKPISKISLFSVYLYNSFFISVILFIAALPEYALKSQWFDTFSSGVGDGLASVVGVCVGLAVGVNVGDGLGLDVGFAVAVGDGLGLTIGVVVADGVAGGFDEDEGVNQTLFIVADFALVSI